MHLLKLYLLFYLFLDDFKIVITSSEVNSVDKIENGEISTTRTDHNNNNNNETLITSTTELLEELKISNQQLIQRVNLLTDNLNKLEKLIQSVNSDVKFFNPTVEHQYVDLNVVNWEAAVEGGFQDVSALINAGQTLGSFSIWSVYVTSSNGSLSVHVGLQSETYNTKGALYVGFTLYIIDADDNVYLTRRHGETNILEIDGNWKFISIQNVILVSMVKKPENKLLKNDTFKLRVRLELLGNGHKLYNSEFGPPLPSKDTQTVIFEVSNLAEKLKNHNLNSTSNSNSSLESISPAVAYTRFQLEHPWRLITNWIVEIRKDLDNSPLLVLSLDDTFDLDKFSSQLFASFKLKISTGGEDGIYDEKQARLNDYKKEKQLFLERIISEENLTRLSNQTLEFKIYLTVFGQNARYYVDL